VVDYEVDYCFGDAGRRSLLLNASVIQSDEGPAELILLAIEDITERKRASEELRQLNETLEQRVAERARSHARLASLVASTADAVIALDLDGTITDWNAGAERIFGYSEQQAVGQHISMLTPPDRPSGYEDIVEQLRRGETLPSFEFVWQTRDRQPKDVSLTISLIKQPTGQVVGASGIVRDITDRKRLEQQLVELAEQERRRIGQELHDSLGQQISALGVLATSLQTTLEEQSSPNLERMEQLVHGIEDAKAQVRLLSRGLLPVEVDAEGLMHALRELTARREEVFGVACIFDCPRTVHVDDNSTATHLYRIAQESINNAVQHAHAEQIIVSLREDGQITLQVRDNGIGLPADPSTAAGSGLRIMRYRAGLIGGTLSMAAGEDGGTVVTCSIPGRERHAEG
jgi:two-component system CheB/CheR fusion protein